MASASFSSDVLSKAIQKKKREKAAKKIRKRKENGWEKVHAEMKSRELSYAIQNLPPELREKILKEFIAIKINEKNEMGWGYVHGELQDLPHCEAQETITKVYICMKCNSCNLTGLCVACWENEMKYHILVDREEANELEDRGFGKSWGDKEQPSERREEGRFFASLIASTSDIKHFFATQA